MWASWQERVARVRFMATFDGEAVVTLMDVRAGATSWGTLTFRVTATGVEGNIKCQ